MSYDKITRICWNTEGWRKPSGPQGKSKNKKAYEYKYGFGHEEWLLDTTKLISGWHYAHLKAISLHRQKYMGQTFNISLYSIDDDTKQRWWVGRILNASVITDDESRGAYLAYKANGWLDEMEQQLTRENANTTEFRNTRPDSFAVIRYRPKDLQLLDIPLQFAADDPAVGATYYVLLNLKQPPKLIGKGSEFVFSPGHSGKKSTARASYERHSSEIDLVHNTIQTELYESFCEKFGKRHVGTELDSGYGLQIDVVVRDKDDKFVFYEIKTSYSVRLCIREALGQLMEYAFFPKANNAKKLVVVSTNAITPEVGTYLRHIRDHYDVPIYYQRYNSETKSLEDMEH